MEHLNNVLFLPSPDYPAIFSVFRHDEKENHGWNVKQKNLGRHDIRQHQVRRPPEPGSHTTQQAQKIPPISQPVSIHQPPCRGCIVFTSFHIPDQQNFPSQRNASSFLFQKGSAFPNLEYMKHCTAESTQNQQRGNQQYRKRLLRVPLHKVLLSG